MVAPALKYESNWTESYILVNHLSKPFIWESLRNLIFSRPIDHSWKLQKAALNTHARQLYWWAHGMVQWRKKRSFCDGKSAHLLCIIHSKTHAKYAHSVSGRPTLKDVEHLRNGSVCKPYERSLYEQTFSLVYICEKPASLTYLDSKQLQINQ